MSHGLRIAVIVLLQTLALAAMIALKQRTLDTGTPIVLETQPIDPRSLFSGDYVRLNYAISTLRLDQPGSDQDFKPHDRAYVVLKPGDPYWQPVSVHHQMPALAPGQVAIRGEVQYAGDSLWNQETRTSEKVRNLRLRYGIESYYVPEGAGRALERPAAGEKISLRVAVDRAGAAGIKAVLVNGRERYVETLW
jgi:Uncharacterized membrane-anchored protein